jgi:hypothetical protein
MEQVFDGDALRGKLDLMHQPQTGPIVELTKWDIFCR